VERLSLRRGETLVLCSDGVEGAEALHSWCCDPEEPPGELAVRIMKLCNTEDMDDATVAVVRLGK
jgi:serine/threonine protein phosphatase PrpC